MSDTYGADQYGVGLFEGVASGYGSNTYGTGAYGMARTEGYGSGAYGDGLYGGQAGAGGNPFPARLQPRKPLRHVPTTHTDDDEAAVALVLTLL